jgi:hypothetical protein
MSPADRFSTRHFNSRIRQFKSRAAICAAAELPTQSNSFDARLKAKPQGDAFLLGHLRQTSHLTHNLSGPPGSWLSLNQVFHFPRSSLSTLFHHRVLQYTAGREVRLEPISWPEN